MTGADVCEAAELVGERAVTLLQLLQPWENQDAETRRVCVELTMELARLMRRLDEARVTG